jgi:hypothetical protein
MSERLLSNTWFPAILADDEAFGQPSRKVLEVGFGS